MHLSYSFPKVERVNGFFGIILLQLYIVRFWDFYTTPPPPIDKLFWRKGVRKRDISLDSQPDLRWQFISEFYHAMGTKKGILWSINQPHEHLCSKKTSEEAAKKSTIKRSQLKEGVALTPSPHQEEWPHLASVGFFWW